MNESKYVRIDYYGKSSEKEGCSEEYPFYQFFKFGKCIDTEAYGPLKYTYNRFEYTKDGELFLEYNCTDNTCGSCDTKMQLVLNKCDWESGFGPYGTSYVAKIVDNLERHNISNLYEHFYEKNDCNDEDFTWSNVLYGFCDNAGMVNKRTVCNPKTQIPQEWDYSKPNCGGTYTEKAISQKCFKFTIYDNTYSKYSCEDIVD